MSNETDTSTSMYHLMYAKGWNEVAFIVAVTQYVVTIWVLELWQGKQRNPDSCIKTTASPNGVLYSNSSIATVIFIIIIIDNVMVKHTSHR